MGDDLNTACVTMQIAGYRMTTPPPSHRQFDNYFSEPSCSFFAAIAGTTLASSGYRHSIAENTVTKHSISREAPGYTRARESIRRITREWPSLPGWRWGR